MNYMTAYFGGNDFLYGGGMLNSGMDFSLGQLVADNDMFKMIRELGKGVPVDDIHNAVDVIRQVGPGGEFISNKHTFKNKNMYEYPDFMDRNNRPDWNARGKKTFIDKCNEKAVNIIENYNCDPLPTKVHDKLLEIIEKREKEAGVLK